MIKRVRSARAGREYYRYGVWVGDELSIFGDLSDCPFG